MSDRASEGAALAAHMRELHRRAAALAAGLAQDTGVHPTDLRALRALDAARERPIAVGELGAQLGLSSAAVSELVDRLEAAGLARRVRDEGDRRRVLVELTETALRFGQERLAPVAAALQRAIDACDDEELSAARRFLERFLAEGEPQAPSSASSSSGSVTGRWQAKRSQT